MDILINVISDYLHNVIVKHGISFCKSIQFPKTLCGQNLDLQIRIQN